MPDLTTTVHKATRLALSTTIPVELKGTPPSAVSTARRWIHIANPNAAIIFLGTSVAPADCVFTLAAAQQITKPFIAASGIWALASAISQNIEFIEGW